MTDWAAPGLSKRYIVPATPVSPAACPSATDDSRPSCQPAKCSSASLTASSIDTSPTTAKVALPGP